MLPAFSTAHSPSPTDDLLSGILAPSVQQKSAPVARRRISRSSSRNSVYERQAQDRRTSLLLSGNDDSALSRKLSLSFDPMEAGGGAEGGMGVELGPRKHSLQQFDPLDTITDSTFGGGMPLAGDEFSDLFLETLAQA